MKTHCKCLRTSSVRVRGNPSERQHGVRLASPAEADTVKRLLGQISVLLEDAEAKSQEFQSQNPTEGKAISPTERDDTL
jgi:hypothetical protein